LVNKILLFILTDDSFDDPIVEMNDSSDNMVLQSDKNVVIDENLDDNDDRSGNDSNGDDDHYPYAKKAPGILCYICSLFVP
jgi:uncharacterized membrane-anchored protein YhcB (DUF1043 family)